MRYTKEMLALMERYLAQWRRELPPAEKDLAAREKQFKIDGKLEGNLNRSRRIVAGLRDNITTTEKDIKTAKRQLGL